MASTDIGNLLTGGVLGGLLGAQQGDAINALQTQQALRNRQPFIGQIASGEYFTIRDFDRMETRVGRMPIDKAIPKTFREELQQEIDDWTV